MNEKPDILNSIRKALWTLVVLISLLALGGAAQLTTNVYWWWIKGRHKPEQALRVVVAAKDISAGSTLRHGDVGLTMRKVGELPDHFCCPHFARILPGHKIHSDFKRGEPIDLEETELWTKSRESQSGGRRLTQ